MKTDQIIKEIKEKTFKQTEFDPVVEIHVAPDVYKLLLEDFNDVLTQPFFNTTINTANVVCAIYGIKIFENKWLSPGHYKEIKKSDRTYKCPPLPFQENGLTRFISSCVKS